MTFTFPTSRLISVHLMNYVRGDTFILNAKTEKVLNEILQIAQKPHANINFGQFGDNDISGVSATELQVAFAYLEKLGLIKTNGLQVYVKPEAFGYLPALREQKKKALWDIWEPRIWQIVMLGIGYVLGRLSG